MRRLPSTVFDCRDVLLGCARSVGELLLCQLCHQPGALHHSTGPGSILNLEHISHIPRLHAIACRWFCVVDAPGAPSVGTSRLSEDRVDSLITDVLFVVESADVSRHECFDALSPFAECESARQPQEVPHAGLSHIETSRPADSRRHSVTRSLGIRTA